MSSAPVCAICGQAARDEPFTAREMTFGRRDPFEYFECSGCGCVQIARVPDNLSDYYPPEYFAFRPQHRLAGSRVRAIMDRLYVPVGTNHQPDELAKWVSGCLFDTDEGRAAARRVDRTIAKLPGFSDAQFLGNWLARNVYA